MGRLAIIKDGVVANVIVTGDEDIESEAGFTLVESDRASVGEFYDGETFSRPKPSKVELARHAGMRHSDTVWTRHELIGDREIMVDVADHEALRRFADRAAREPLFTIPWPQPRKGTTIKLNAKDIIALNESVSGYLIAKHQAHAAVLEAIAAGKITTDDEVDFPPAPIPQWPARNED